jgi:hypothetical protein
MEVDGDSAVPGIDEKKREQPDEGLDGSQPTKKAKTEAGALTTATAAPTPPTPLPVTPGGGLTPGAFPGVGAAGGAAGAAAAAGAAGDDDYQPNPTMIEMVANFLMRVALIAAEPKDTQHLSERCGPLDPAPHPAPCTLHWTPYTLNPTSDTLHPTP